MPETLRFGPPAITVDVEDWPESSLSPDLPVSSRVVVNTERVLGILRESNVKATMFVLGKVAVAFPELVREIRAEDHEVACHDHGHVAVFRRSREDFEQTLRRCKDRLEDLTGMAVRGYRAPDFSITRSSLWGFEALVELGFEYDSSIFPIQRRRYGIPDWPTHPVRVILENGAKIVELPLGTVRLLGRNWPIGGGGYHRLLPGILSRHFVRAALASAPFVFYCHPYEFDPREFREMALRVPFSRRVHQGLGRRQFETRFKRFLQEFGARRICDVLATPECVQHEVRLAEWEQGRNGSGGASLNGK